MNITSEMIRIVWNKATSIAGQDDEIYRMDLSGVWIKMKDFNNPDSIYGWTIYSVDGSEQNIQNINQLIPIHTHNNSVPISGINGSDYANNNIVF
jgi:hypothetical protein